MFNHIAPEQHLELESEVEDEQLSEDEKPVLTQSADWTVISLIGKYKRGNIELQPQYQREYVWATKPELPSRLIESLLLNIPVPPIYFAKMPDGKMEVIDGQQRLTTLVKFLDGDFTLQKLQRMASLNGKKFSELSDPQKTQIEDAQIRSVIIDAGKNPGLRYEVFERLNRGSMALNEMEIRNCVYRGDFCDLLAKLESEKYWRDVKGGSNPDARFIEREMILRFFAFAQRIDFYTGQLKRFLSDYMENYAPKNGEAKKLDELAEQFRSAMRNVYSVFGAQSGRLYTAGEANKDPDGKWETKFSVSALDIQASALMGHDNAHIQQSADAIREAYLLYLLSNPAVREAISSQPSGTVASKTRWSGFKPIVLDILNANPVEPRFFSFEFRENLWVKDQKCGICGNQIHKFEDCAVDHIKPYSTGGKTEASNAQLAHRSCNSRKCANV